ncbi:MAG: M23 family metallopeptidase [Chitinophagaceae bacterium]
MKCCFILLLVSANSLAIAQPYTQYRGYFRNPLNVPMQLVSNFGELRTNHWHLGLDIRTQQKENLPVYAAAEGYIAKISIEPGGFGRAIYINHPNGYTTLYAHLNNFTTALHQWVIEQQYLQQQWDIKLDVPPHLFPVNKGDFIAYSGNTGGSAGPHVHFEIRDTKSDKCVRPLLFGFPIADAVPPTIVRLALYDRNKSVYHQNPKLFGIKKTGSIYSLTQGNTITTTTNRISFAISTYDRLSGSNNPNGIYSARMIVDDEVQSEFILDNIDYNETRYMNAHIDYRLKTNGGSYVQHLSRMPGDFSNVYSLSFNNGVIDMQDTLLHSVVIEVKDSYNNLSRMQFNLQYRESSATTPAAISPQKLIPGYVNIFETDSFELFTSEYGVYDTVNITYTLSDVIPTNAKSPIHNFSSAAIPVHDSLTVRIKASQEVPLEWRNRIIIKNISGKRTILQKATWQGDWLSAKFRQFGSYQVFIDNQPPTFNAPGYGDTIDLRRSTRLVISPKDNFKTIKNFRAEVNGQWLLFTNDKGYSYIYRFDDYFPSGVSKFTVTAEDIVGNITTKNWYVRR